MWKIWPTFKKLCFECWEMVAFCVKTLKNLRNVTCPWHSSIGGFSRDQWCSWRSSSGDPLSLFGSEGEVQSFLKLSSENIRRIILPFSTRRIFSAKFFQQPAKCSQVPARVYDNSASSAEAAVTSSLLPRSNPAQTWEIKHNSQWWESERIR